MNFQTFGTTGRLCHSAVSITWEPTMTRTLSIFLLMFFLQSCTVAKRGSEEYWYNKMVAEQRAQCSLLPEPLSGSCLRDVAAKSYQDFVKNRQSQSVE
jgi:hypothetical protein